MPHVLTEKEKLQRKLVRKINAYAAAKIAEANKEQLASSSEAHDAECELNLQRNQLNKLIESIFALIP